jgi:electron transport complex protein RnfG
MIKDILRLGIILLLICAIATGILAWVNSSTINIITDRKAKEAIETRQKLMPDAKTFEEKKAVEDTTLAYFIAKDDKGETLGYTFVAENRGYSSVVKTMVALDKTFKIITIQVIDQNETPGLGTWCQDKSFPDRFKGLGVEDLKVDKDGGKVKSITGATITTRAITNSVHDAIQVIQGDVTVEEPATPGQQTEKKMDKTMLIIQKMLPAAKTIDEVTAVNKKGFNYYLAKDDKDSFLAYAFIAQKKGYCSVIRSLVCVDKNYKITHLKVLKLNETPGLGNLCADNDFIQKFLHKGPTELKLDKDGGNIAAITGATISSNAMTSSIREAVIALKADVANNPAVGGKL